MHPLLRRIFRQRPIPLDDLAGPSMLAPNAVPVAIPAKREGELYELRIEPGDPLYDLIKPGGVSGADEEDSES